jgi:hypothetical protein
MSRRRTCCCEDAGGDVCFSFAVTAQHLQYCTLTCATTGCTVYLGESCGTVASFGVQNTYTRALGQLQPQQFVVSRDADVCVCGIPCVYTWTPPETTWDTSICFKMNGLGNQCFGCPEVIDQHPPPNSLGGAISVTLGGPLLCPQVCGCCGTNTRFVSIQYTRDVPSSVVSGACGDVTIGGIVPAWTSGFTVQYCWDVTNPCTMTLFRIFDNSQTAFAPSYGPGAFNTTDCDCGTNTVNTCDTALTGSNCSPFTGDWATIYAAAGSPPATLNCGSCKC